MTVHDTEVTEVQKAAAADVHRLIETLNAAIKRAVDVHLLVKVEELSYGVLSIGDKPRQAFVAEVSKPL